jgi:hypothetical protein
MASACASTINHLESQPVEDRFWRTELERLAKELDAVCEKRREDCGIRPARLWGKMDE